MISEPVLIIGGTGALGRRIAEWVRRRHPGLPLLLGARDQGRARTFARDLGNAAATTVDLAAEDLGLGGHRPRIVVAAFKDHAHASCRFALTRGLPYVALSEAAFEIAPLAAMSAHYPQPPLLLIGHLHGGLPAIAALHLARGFSRVDSIRLGAIFDPADPLPPGAELDMARIMKAGPPPLARVNSEWQWLATGAERVIRRTTESDVAGEAAGLTDALGLWAPTGASSVRLDMGEGPTARAPAGAPGHEVIIEIDGLDAAGAPSYRRWIMADPDGNVAFGAKGIALAIERLLGLRGGTPPRAGLHFPETLFDPAATVAEFPALGLSLSELDRPATG